MAATAPHFPDTLVWLLPDQFQMLDQLLLQRPRRSDGSQTERSPLIHGVDELAVHIELELSGSCVADAHRRGTPVPGQPGHFPLDELSLAGDAIHDLQLVRASRHGAPEPLSPRLRFIAVSCGDQRQ